MYEQDNKKSILLAYFHDLGKQNFYICDLRSPIFFCLWRVLETPCTTLYTSCSSSLLLLASPLSILLYPALMPATQTMKRAVIQSLEIKLGFYTTLLTECLWWTMEKFFTTTHPLFTDLPTFGKKCWDRVLTTLNGVQRKSVSRDEAKLFSQLITNYKHKPDFKMSNLELLQSLKVIH